MAKRTPPSIDELLEQASCLSLEDFEPIPPGIGFPDDLEARSFDEGTETPESPIRSPAARKEPGLLRRWADCIKRYLGFKHAQEQAEMQELLQTAHSTVAPREMTAEHGRYHPALAKARPTKESGPAPGVSREPPPTGTPKWNQAAGTYEFNV